MSEQLDPSELPIDEPAISKLVAMFYRRVREDDLLAPMYPADDWEGAEQRLRDFLIFRFTGNDRYIQDRGHPRLGMRHADFKIGIAERDRWLQLMNEAIVEAEIDRNYVINLQNFFGNVAEFLRKITPDK